jgi:hypothetical protein
MRDAPPSRLRLPLRFDAPALAAEAKGLPANAWADHFNASYHNGGWTGITLRGPTRDPKRLYVGPEGSAASAHEAAPAPQDTPVLASCPRVAEALSRLRCPVRSARLLRLAPGGVIDEHCDSDLSYERGDVRLHVVLTTGPAVEFYVDGERAMMDAGECWYLDLSRPHRVANRGNTDRIHLVVDVGVDDWLRQQVAAGDTPVRAAPTPGGADEFARFRERVFADDTLATRLRAQTERDPFVALTVTLGRAEGFAFDATDVRAALSEGQRQWMTQWMV